MSILHGKEKHKWESLSLGTNIDAVETAGRFGIDADRAVDYHADSQGTQLNYEVVAETITEVRANRQMSKAWKTRKDEKFRRRGWQR